MKLNKILLTTLLMFVGTFSTNALASMNMRLSAEFFPHSGCQADYSPQINERNRFDFSNNNFSDCVREFRTARQGGINLGQSMAYRLSDDERIQDVVINITNTAQDIVFENIGKIKSRDQQITAMNQSMEDSINILKRSFQTEINESKKFSQQWQDLRPHFNQEAAHYIQENRDQISKKISKTQQLSEVAQEHLGNTALNRSDTPFSRYVNAQGLASKLADDLDARKNIAPVSFARSLFSEDDRFAIDRHPKISAEYQRYQENDLLDAQAQTLFNAAEKFYQGRTQRHLGEELIDHLSAERLGRSGVNLPDLDRHRADQLINDISTFNHNYHQARGQVELTRQLIKNGHQFNMPTDVVERVVDFSEKTIDTAEQVFYEESVDQGLFLSEMAVKTLDIVTHFIPVVSPSRDFYELITGTNLFTGETLSTTDLVFAGIGVATLGAARPIGAVIRGSINLTRRLGRSSNSVNRLATNLNENAMRELRTSLNQMGIRSTDEVTNTRLLLERTLGRNVETPGKIAEVLNETGRANLVSFNRAISELHSSGIQLSRQAEGYLANQVRYASKMLVKGQSFNSTELVRIAKSYESIRQKMTAVRGTSFSGEVWRAVPDRFSDEVWNITNHNRLANHRYSQPGNAALYTALGNKDLGRRTIMAELRRQNLEGYHFTTVIKSFDNVLDLTNERTLRQLGVDESSIKKISGKYYYEITHQIGSIARDLAFQAIRAPSARTRGYTGTNLIILGD